jgi:hypothetical protein
MARVFLALADMAAILAWPLGQLVRVIIVGWILESFATTII